MVPVSQKLQVERVPKRKRFPWTLGITVSLGLMAILAFVVLALLILWSQGIAQGINILTIISIIVGFVVSVLGLLISFLQWHHPKSADHPEPSVRSFPQTLIFD